MKKRNMHLGANPSLFRNAYHLRNNPTEAERILWLYLKDKQMEGIRFRRQHPLINYVADFYSHQIKLVIELDGGYHDDKVQKISDNAREETLINANLTILRFSNEDVIFDIAGVLNYILHKIMKLKNKKLY